ncbi:popeye domain-containing protein [Aeoliella sp. ICT_H6.2]|uniref:Popeye domain-containing protein n=1 Tax=Aeoliella straminimaris TaxID=2954799 RepID=A0A9X2FJ86_9BACT|nr:popeye domain-containing protein [Aeoliella straminimaris]MCO6047991.1 popeye domain-containing protein [Aeoliella straminimaris]
MSDWCIHAANLFYLASFVGRDMLWLRTLTCFGLAFGLIFFSACTPNPMYGPAFWHAAFLLINIYQIYHLVGQRRRLGLNPKQQVIQRAMLDGLNDEELRNSLTHTVCSPDGRVRLLTADGNRQLSPDELAFREIAFDRLSRAEMINLLARRVWKSTKKLGRVASQA